MGSKKAKMKNHEKKGKYNLESDDSPASHDKVISDPRFSRVHTDPRFREAPKHETKVAIDSRFNRIFTHKSFLPCSAPVDKRGKPKDNPTNSILLRHYYKDKRKVEHSNSSCGDEDKEEEELMEVNCAKTKNGKGVELEETSESDTDADEGEDEKVYEEEAPDMQEEVLEIEKVTHRLAVVNMDWRYVKAVDLYVLFISFVPPKGLIKSVAIYPTEFGLQCMKEEDVHGPVGLFEDENEISDEDCIDNEKLRAYEKSRMRYYHAVVECDSSSTANYIYKQCNGVEFLRSSNLLDLRFIPDNMKFKHPPHDLATEKPANYDEHKDFYSRALQHSKVELTWDEDEPLRARTLKRKFNDEQLAQLERKELLTSYMSESDDGEDNNETDDGPDKKPRKLYKYHALLLSGNGSDEDVERDDDLQDMEVKFITGVEGLNKHIMEKEKKSETVWDASRRKRREKKKIRNSNSEDTNQETNGEASKKVLELLLVDDKGTDTGLKGYNLKFKKGRGKRRENAIDEGKIPNNAYDDPRFAALFSPDYAIDPTNPQFKRSATHARQLAQKQQKGHMELLAESEHTKLPTLSSDDAGMMQKGEEEGFDILNSKKDNYELSSLVKSIKMKSKQVQLSSNGKTRKDGKSQFKGMEKKTH